MVAAFFRRELCARLAGDEAAENRLLTFELARRVVGVDPVGDFSRVAGLHAIKLVRLGSSIVKHLA